VSKIPDALFALVSHGTVIVVVALAVQYGFPYLPGVFIQRTLVSVTIFAIVYCGFEQAMLTGFTAAGQLIGTSLTKQLTKDSAASKSNPADLVSQSPPKSNSNLVLVLQRVFLPAPLYVLILFRLFIGVSFTAILSAFVPQAFHAVNLLDIVASGLFISIASALSPIALLIFILGVDIVVLPPLFFMLWIVGKDKRTKTDLPKYKSDIASFLGYLMGGSVGMLLFPIMLLLKSFPQPAPPYVVPENLSAKQYYTLGVKYKDVGWTEQSRDALNRAIALDLTGEFGVKAKRYMNTKLPRNKVPNQAVERNIQAFNYMASGNLDQAKESFEDLISQYPHFEWPYSNLAAIYVQEKNPAKAKKLVEDALAINPDYVNAWMRLADIAELENDQVSAAAHVEKAFELDPDDALVKLKRAARQKK
jgi:predicted nucleic acid-binding protein